MSKFTLVMNSHSLSDFQECEQKDLYKSVIGLTSIIVKPKMERGSVMAKWAEIYYYNKIKYSQMRQRVLANPLLWVKRFVQKCGFDQKEAFKAYGACIEYASYYKNETWQPLHVEKGFSKILYEDAENLFVWEGRPDLHYRNGNYEGVSDLKTQAQKNSIYQFNNQARGYLWALNCTEFVYNYIVLLSNRVEFRREPFTFTKEQLEQWRSDTIEWFFRKKYALTNMKFLRSWNCQNKYGKCDYCAICEQTRDDIRAFVIKANYKIEKPYRSW